MTNSTATPRAALTREDVAAALRVGRIGFLNVYPMHYALGIEPAFTGVPTALNRALLDGTVDVACISSIEYARHADDLILLPSLCIAADGAVGSIFAITNASLETVTDIWATPSSATSVVLLEMLCRLRGNRPNMHVLDGDPADVLAEPGRAVLLIGDEALAARGEASLADMTFIDLGERWQAETGLPMVYAVWAMRRETADREPAVAVAFDELLVSSVEQFAASVDGVTQAAAAYDIDEHAAQQYFDRLCYGFGQRERKGLVRYLRMATEYGLLGRVPAPEFINGSESLGEAAPIASMDAGVEAHIAARAAEPDGGSAGSEAEARERVLAMYSKSVGTSAALKQRPEDVEAGERALQVESDARAVDVDGVLAKALADERINDVEAVALLQSGRLLDIGQVANELRMRRTPADVVTFVVDRNINYTNICITDCGFCAFYRKPGDTNEGYLHSTETILQKIQETVDLGGTAALMQGGHNPDLDINWYVELFRTIKQHYPTFHLHALSPPEIEHIARRSKMTNSEVLTTLRDAGLDSLPGDGGEVLVDRVRRIIAPKKTKTDDWLGIMREAQRVGMSTTASMMYGHVELLAERVEHMRRVREVQDEVGGFRAFISWTFQPGNTPMAQLIDSGLAPYADQLPTAPTPMDYLLMQAVSRIYLDNVDNIQSSWVTQGMKVGQAALYFGANDMGSIMIEENVVSSAGTTFRATVDDFVHAIGATGMRAVQRDTLYRTVAEH